ncbi:MAG: UPF0182 family protein, partial [Candidatus Hermodarchaeota archaeon]
MAKKSCEKHKKFNYYCEDCQRLNQESEARFNYSLLKKTRRYKKPLLILAVVVAIVISLAVLWWWPAWYGNINLQSQLYTNKAGGLDYFDFFFLNFWSTNFLFNKTALIGALIGSIIMSIPPERNLLTIIGTKLRFGKPTYLKSLIFWWTAGFVLFYLFGMTLDANNGFSWAIYLIENGQIELHPTIIFDAFDIIFNSNNTDFTTIFLYSNLILPVLGFIFVIILIRLALIIVKYIYLRRNDYLVISIVLIIVGLVFGLIFCFIPTMALDGINVIQIVALVFGFFTFLSLGVALFVFGKIRYKKDTKNYIFPRSMRRKLIYVVIICILFTITPLLVSIGPLINLNNTTVWTEQQWIKKYQREIEWTRECAGLDMFEERPIQNFTTSATSEGDLVKNNSIRVYDQNFAVKYLAAEIGSTFEGLADSDIIYFNNTEYWVAPKTVKFSEIEGDTVSTNTELYDHVEGFFAMDTFNGTIVPDVSEIFNISVDYPIFFGESESRRYLEQTEGYEGESIGAYDSDILLNTGWEKGIENLNYAYEGEPDGVLTGLEGFWKTTNIGLLAYAFRDKHEYVINRNVKNRIYNILLPHLKVDYDPYLVFDYARGKLYYAVSIYTQINIGSYSRYPILRFLGVSLIDVLNGNMKFYQNPNLNTINDPTYLLWEIYLTKYNWQPTPSWLLNQLRYPEEMFELQLEANYIYHVQNSQTWKRGDDFHERPENGDLFYIESDLGNGIEFIGLDLVEYKGRTATLLAGMYVIRHGKHFGEAIFYHTRTSSENLIGPKTARDTYISEATQEISLISNAIHGNTLLYPLGGSIYYFIPTYSSSGDIQNLGLAGFVEAFTREVYYDFEVLDAANQFLNISDEVTPPNITLSYNFAMEDSMTYPDDPANFIIKLQNLDTNFSAPELQITVNLTLYSATTNNVDYDLILPPYLYPIENSTYIDGSDTFVDFTVLNTTLYFGEGLVLNGFVNTTKGDIVIHYVWTLIV